jgi:hypothetical protein
MVAHRQWATRPADQRFRTLGEMLAVTRSHRARATESTYDWGAIGIESDANDVVLSVPGGTVHRFTHHSFGRLGQAVGAGAHFLRTLPAPMVASILNFKLGERRTDGESDAKLLTVADPDGTGSTVHSITTERYERLWNHEVIERCMGLADRFDLVPAGATFREANGTAGEKSLYASDHDAFIFLMSRERTVMDPAGQALHRGVIVSNTEVGGIALSIMFFLFRDICGNHIIWGMDGLESARLRHLGKIRDRWIQSDEQLGKYLNAGTEQESSMFDAVKRLIAPDKEKVVSTLYERRSLALPKKTWAAAFDAVIPELDGDPRSFYGMAQGVTRISQQGEWADERFELDSAAGKLLAVR